MKFVHEFLSRRMNVLCFTRNDDEVSVNFTVKVYAIYMMNGELDVSNICSLLGINLLALKLFLMSWKAGNLTFFLVIYCEKMDFYVEIMETFDDSRITWVMIYFD